MPMGKEASEPRVVICQGVSRWDEPCMLPASMRCEVCHLWFCEQHFVDPDWHPCANE